MNLKKELIIRILAVHFNLRFLLFTPKICQICQVAELWCLGNHTKSYNSYTKPNKYTAQGFSRTLSTEMAFILCSDHSFFNNFIGISIIFEKKFFFIKSQKKQLFHCILAWFLSYVSSIRQIVVGWIFSEIYTPVTNDSDRHTVHSYTVNKRLHVELPKGNSKF